MRHFTIILFVSAAFLLLTTSALCQTDFWQPTNGPYGGSVYTLAIDSGGKIYAGTNFGIFLSTDNGDNWMQPGSSWDYQYIRSITIDHNGVVYAGTYGNGISKSTDGGGSWTQAGLTMNYVNTLLVNRDNTIFAGTGAGIYRSTNGGETWLQINNGLTNALVRSLVVDTASNLIAGTYGGGIYRSTDDGDNWVQSNQGLQNLNIKVLSIGPDSQVFAGTDGGGAYRSTDYGLHWIQINNGLTNPYINSLGIDSSGYIYAGSSSGVYRSTDNGNNWTTVGLQGIDVRALVVDHTGSIFSATGSGVYRSSDHGSAWMSINAGLRVITVRAISTGSGGLVIAGTDAGIQRSTDRGISWSFSGLSGKVIYSLRYLKSGIILAGTSGGLYRSTDGGSAWLFSGLTTLAVRSIVENSANDVFTGTYGLGIYRSTDQGMTWVPTGSTDTYVYSLTIDPVGTIYAGTFGGGVFRSTDNGNVWTEVVAGLENTTIRSVISGSDGTILAGSAGGGAFRSTNRGDTWSTSGLPYRYVYAMTVAAQGDIFAGTDNGPYKSTDNGITWARINSGMPSVEVMSFELDEDSYIYAATDGAGIYRSQQPTSTLRPASLDIQGGWNLLSLQMNVLNCRADHLFPSAISRAFCYTDHYVISDSLFPGYGYWLKFPVQETITILGSIRSIDTVQMREGWNIVGSLSSPVPTSNIITIPPGIVTSLFFGFSGKYKYSDTLLPGKGYWVKASQPGALVLSAGFSVANLNGRIQMLDKDALPPSPPEMMSERKESSDGNDIFSDNHPNPFNPETRIQYTLPVPGWLSIRVYNILGEVVSTLVDELQPEGLGSIIFKSGGLPSGAYYYRIQLTPVANRDKYFSHTGRMLLLR